MILIKDPLSEQENRENKLVTDLCSPHVLSICSDFLLFKDGFLNSCLKKIILFSGFFHREQCTERTHTLRLKKNMDQQPTVRCKDD